MRLLILLAFIASCASTEGIVMKHPLSGYCFKAEGVSKYKCYHTQDDCLRRESAISDEYPWATIEDPCSLRRQ